MSTRPAATYRLSPSDFGYLYEDCKRCYSRKVKRGGAPPSMPKPGVFSRMNSLLQNALVGMNMRDIHPDLPDAVIEAKEGWLESAAIPRSSCSVAGRFDILCRAADGTLTVIDFKIIEGTAEKVAERYASQLHAYAYALEHPLDGAPQSVGRMGIVTLSPESISFDDKGVVFGAQPRFFEVKRDMPAFLRFVRGIGALLDGRLPSPTKGCPWCEYSALGPASARMRRSRTARRNAGAAAGRRTAAPKPRRVRATTRRLKK